MIRTRIHKLTKCTCEEIYYVHIIRARIHNAHDTPANTLHARDMTGQSIYFMCTARPVMHIDAQSMIRPRICR